MPWEFIWYLNSAALVLSLAMSAWRGRLLRFPSLAAWLFVGLVQSAALRSVPVRSDFYAITYLIFLPLNAAAMFAAVREAHRERGRGLPSILSESAAALAFLVALVAVLAILLPGLAIRKASLPLIVAQYVRYGALVGAFVFSAVSWGLWAPVSGSGRGSLQRWLVAVLGVKALAAALQVQWITSAPLAVFSVSALLDAGLLAWWALGLEPEAAADAGGIQRSAADQPQ